MQPMNYMLDVKNPFEGAVQGIQTGLALNSAIDKAAEQQRQIALQKQMQGDLATLSSNPNPTADDFVKMTVKYPQLAEHFKSTWTMMNQDQQQSRLNQATQIYSALNAGQNDLAAQLANDQAKAFRNSGREEDAKHLETIGQLIQMSPETAKTSTGLMLSSILGPEKFSTTFAGLAKLPSEIQKSQAEATEATYKAKNTPQRLELENTKTVGEIKNIDSQIAERSGRLGLDRDKLQTDTELKLLELNQKTNPALNLDGEAKKLINDSTISSVAAEQSAGQMLSLANRIESAGGGYGAGSKLSEWIKGATGAQGAMTQLRNEYTRLRTQQGIKNLPPGPASDKDVQMAMKGMPDDTADASTIASFLRGMAKLQQYSSVAENAKAEWVNAVGHMGKPKTDINVDGVAVPAGTTFTNFARQYFDAKTAARAAEQNKQQATSGNRSYMRWATPQQGQ